MHKRLEPSRRVVPGKQARLRREPAIGNKAPQLSASPPASTGTRHIGGQTKRQTSTILAVDVAGYARLMEVDEEETHHRFMSLLGLFLKPQLAADGGRLIKHTGDGFLAAFHSVADGVRCGVTMQHRLAAMEQDELPERRLWFRMGIHVCETIVEDDDVYGEGVNVAARLQTYAEPGDIVISDTVATQVPELDLVDLGDLYLKNMTKSVHGYSLRIGSLSRRSISPARAMERLPSIAVLPFWSHQLKPDEAYLADGFVEDLVTALASLRELFVISRTSTLAYAGKPVDVRLVGRDLGVHYVLTGIIRRTPSHIRVLTELTDATSGAIIQTERYDGEPTNFFEAQSDLALRVVAAIAPQVREWELRRSLRKHTECLDAYDLTLRGIHLLYRLDYEAFSKARGFLQQAIVSDPDYAAPHAYAAHWHVFRVGQGWSPDPRSDALEGGRLAAAAIDLDKQNALALAIRGHTHSFILKQTDVALGYFERALAASPNCAMAWALSSATRSYLGRGAEAVARAEYALRLSPQDIHAFYYQTALTLAHYASGDFEAAARSGLKAISQNPSFCTNLRHTAASLVAVGRLHEAREIAQMHIRAQPRFALSSFANSCPYRDDDKRALFIERLRDSGLPY